MARMLRHATVQLEAANGTATQGLDTSPASTDATSFGNLTETLNDRRLPDCEKIHAELVQHLWSYPGRPTPPKWDSSDVDNPATTTLLNSFEKSITNSLSFDTMQLRQDAIPRAFEKTCSWIFQGPSSGASQSIAWPSFPDWLETDVAWPYWITGKPGSGKSTLMSFVLQHPHLQKHLRVWAQDLPLVVASYYAWVAGANLQKSIEGLMRTVLYQVLSRNPCLVQPVAARRWALFTTLRSVAVTPNWDLRELEESFEALLSECDKSLRLVLFVDGLDEFESLPAKVIEFIQHTNTRRGIKMCVAGRQWTEFNDAFRANPMLRMQDINMADIKHIVKTKLEGNAGFSELRRIFPLETMHLINEVAKKSNNVLLWVTIVIKALLTALTEGDGLAELQATIDRLPSSLADLYDAIWASINGRNISKSAEMLTIVKVSRRPLSCVTLWLADEEHSLSSKIKSITVEKRLSILEIMRRRLDSRTRGILEVVETSQTVDFLHRTARDWASKPEVSERISLSLRETFDPYFLLFKAETLDISIRSDELAKIRVELPWALVDKCLWYAFNVRDENRELLIRALDMFDNNMRGLLGAGAIKTMQDHQHWSACLVDGMSSPTTNTFLGLTARFCILPYLQATLVSNPEAIKGKTAKHCRSLLENAIFGSLPYSEVTDPVSNPKEGDTFHISQEKRLEVIAFLLQNGADRRQKTINGNAVIDDVRMHKAVAKERKTDRQMHEEYWGKVEAMMGPRGASSKKLFRSVSNWARK